mgnify:CR=1 FL=1
MRAPLLGLTLFTLACGGSSDSSTGLNTGPNLKGTYDLTTVNNQSLPVAFADSTLKGGQLVMSDSGWSQLSVVLYKAGGSADGAREARPKADAEADKPAVKKAAPAAEPKRPKPEPAPQRPQELF